MAGEPLPPVGGDSDAALAAARGLLATLTAGRASLLQLAATHLPVDRVIALHRAVADDAGWLDDAGAMLERRLAVQGRATAGLGRVARESVAAPVVAKPVAPVAAPVVTPVVAAPVVAKPVAPVAAPVVTPPVPAPGPAPVAAKPVEPAPAPVAAKPAPLPPVATAPAKPPAPVASPAPVAPAKPADTAATPAVALPRDEGRPVAPPRAEPPRERTLPPGPERMVRSLLQERTPAPRGPSPGTTLSQTDVASLLAASSPDAEPAVPPKPAARVEPPKPAEPAPRAPEKPAPVAAPKPVEPVAAPKPVEPVAAPKPVEPAPAEPTLYGLGAAEPTGAFDEPSGPFEAPPDESEAEPDGLMILDENSFSGPGENTLNWAAPKKAAVTIEDLLGSVEPESDATLLSPLGVRGGDDLADWAASALGAPSEPRARAAAPTPAAPTRAEEPAPRLREPRVAGSTGAAVDVRAAAKGVPPRIAAPEAIEVAEPTGEFPAIPEDDGEIEDEPVGFHVHFERSAPARPAPRAPRLTEDDTGETTQPGAPAPEPGRGIHIDDRQVAALLEEAQNQARRGDLQKAIQAFSDALDMRPTLTEAHIGRGRCHLELGDYSSAMSDFARAEDLAPDRPDAHVATGDLYFARKEYKRAIEFYDQAVELDGSHAMARCRRGISHYYRKNYRQAFQDLQRALALDPEIPNIRKYVQMAQKKLERGE